MAHLLTPEFRLLAACAWHDEASWPVQRDRVLSLITPRLDPRRFHELVERHRVQALASAVLDRAVTEAGMDVEWIRCLRPAARQTRLRSLRLHSEWLRLEKMCRDAGIRARTLKGTALSDRLYGDVTMRHTRDIDVLVAPEHLEALAALLTAAGYAVDHGLAPDRRKGWQWRLCRSLEYHISCLSPEGICIELHSHIERQLESGLDNLWSELAWATEPGASARFDLLYCCLHGCRHGWSRLKWLGDLHLMAARIPETAWPAVIDTAGKLRLEPLLAETLLLLHWITGLPLPAPVMPLIADSGPQARRLALQAIEWISRPEEALNSSAPADQFSKLNLEWQVSRRLPARELASYWLTHALFSASDLRHHRLPAGLTALYPVIRPISYLGRNFFTHQSKSR